MQLNSSLGNRPRKLWLRGLPDTLIEFDLNGNPEPPGALIAAVTGVVSGCMGLGYCIQNAAVPLPNAGSWYRVVSMAPTAGGAPTTDLVVSPTINPSAFGGAIYFQGLNRNLSPGFPRTLVPTSYVIGPPSVVTVPWLYRANTNPYFPQKMKFFVLSEGYPAITSGAFARYGTHKTGRAFGVPRGRILTGIRRQ